MLWGLLKRLKKFKVTQTGIRLFLLTLCLATIFPKNFSSLFLKPTFVWPWNLVGKSYQFEPDEIINLSNRSYNEIFLLQNTMSASFRSANMKIAFFVIIIVSILLFLRYVRPFLRIHTDFNNFHTLYFFIMLIITTLHSMLAVGDLPDEAYVWASKIENLRSSGVLGVLMWDNEYQESSVSTLPFLITYILHLEKVLTIEQSLILTSVLQQIIFISILFIILTLLKLPKVFIFVQILVIGFSSAITSNVALGFDSLGAGCVLMTWIFFELNPYQVSSKTLNRVKNSVAVIAPLVRLDLAVVSLVIVFGRILEIVKQENAFRSTLIQICKALYLPALIIMCWISYKLVNFGSIVPAMVKYKSPVFDERYIFLGLTYIRDSLTFQTCLLLTIISAYFMIDSRNIIEDTKLKNLTLKLSIISVISFFSVAFTGGDYFGAKMARYVIPSVSAWLVMFLIIYSRFELQGFSKFEKIRKPLKSFRNSSLRRRVLVLLILGLNSLFIQNSSILPNFSPEIVPRRATCDSLAGNALKSHLINAPGKLVIATSEVNGIAYSLDAKLLDLSSLVESRNYPTELTPPDGGFLFYKYRTPLSAIQASKVDVIWFWGSANCDDFTSNESVKLAFKENKIGKGVDSLVNSWVSEFRIGSLSQLHEKNFIPVIVEFSYIWKDQTKGGTGVFLVKQKLLKKSFDVASQ